MRIFWTLFLLIGLQFSSVISFAASTKIHSIAYSNQASHSRITFSSSLPTIHKVFLLNNPSRLVVDFKNTVLKTKFKQPLKSHPYFKKIRMSQKDKTGLRVVIDLKHPVVQKNFNLAPNKKSGHRFVIDLSKATKKTTSATRTSTAKSQKKIVRKSSWQKKKQIVIAIDAGHGGIDPGAHGPEGTLEKKVVLAIAKKLAARINAKHGMKAVLVRKSDTFVKLRKRMDIARAAKADLFISLHADAFPNPEVRGASIYVLSQNGASDEASHWLAERENKADLLGGVSLDNNDNTLTKVLIELSQNATKEASRKIAKRVLKYFKGVTRMHKNTVQKANFAVLKSPDIPSILIETAYISNPFEERNLSSKAHQDKIANAIFKGVVSYFKEYSRIIAQR
ncbi:MAG: N-acetylmuramoyl-L-alanine amidase [Methylococcales bacterium]|nr:N-acetylmuramoyl-L-alanine amidase [Methylococcales bacterium]MCK5925227.1 N-acetylmuramoyl-L-alanine amidase [Methylococcales bacterium]